MRHLTWWRFYLLSPSLSFPPLFSHFQSLSFTLHRNTTQHCTKHHHLTFHSPLNILQKKIIQCNYLQSWFLPQVENPSINVIDWQTGTPAAIKGEFVFIGNNTDNSTDPHLTSISPIYFCFCLCHFLRTLHNFNYTVALSSAYLYSHETISTSGVFMPFNLQTDFATSSTVKVTSNRCNSKWEARPSTLILILLEVALQVALLPK